MKETQFRSIVTVPIGGMSAARQGPWLLVTDSPLPHLVHEVTGEVVLLHAVLTMEPVTPRSTLLTQNMLVDQAAWLMAGATPDEHPEYLRGMAELIANSSGAYADDDDANETIRLRIIERMSA